MTTILIVCTANICRSPMAEALLRAQATRHGHGWNVHSAGTAAAHGFPPASHAVAAMAKFGLDISTHISRPVRSEYITGADVVLVMSGRHRDDILRDFDLSPENLFLFNEIVGRKEDVDDPIGRPVEEFHSAAQQLKLTIERGFDWLQRFTLPGAP